MSLRSSVVVCLTMVTPLIAWSSAFAGGAFKLTADDAALGDAFGRVSISGDLAVVGATGDDDEGFFTGSAYVFRREADGNWLQEAKLTAADADEGDNFGNAVAISGNLILVGAFFDEEAGLLSGSAYVFRRVQEGEWIQEAKLIGDGVGPQNRFGFSVAIDGDLAIVGAPHINFSEGHAFAFRRDASGIWTQEAVWTGDSDPTFDKMGWSVSISGNLAAIGNPSEIIDQGQGSVYVFRTDAPGEWTFETKLINEVALSPSDFLGFSVAIDGNVVVAGTFPLVVPPEGAAYVFRRQEPGIWNEEALLTSGEIVDEYARNAISVSGDIIVVGAPHDGDLGFLSGAAYVYKFDPDGCEAGECMPWVEQAKFTAEDTIEEDRFGQFVGLDGTHAIIGVPGDDDACPKVPICGSGSAWVFSFVFDQTGDLDGDGTVGIQDFLLLLAAWGACPEPCPASCPADLDGDCVVGIVDFLILLANWG